MTAPERVALNHPNGDPADGDQPDVDTETARGFAARTLSTDAILLSSIRRGGNARVWRVDDTGGRSLAVLKRYPAPPAGGRDRRTAEAAALAFLADCGEPQVPRLLATDAVQALTMLSFMAGGPATCDAPPADAMADALAFIERLHGYRRRPGADALPMAAEACLSWREILAQVAVRQARLAAVSAGVPALADLLDRLGVAVETLTPWAEGQLASGDDLAREFWTLSPSDFGFHNALRTPEGALVFLDFEYFGWDDPAKLAVDLELHPAMRIAPAALSSWHARLAALYGAEDHAYTDRVRVYRPLLALRWTCILLNEFLPERWRQRQAAGVTGRLDEVLERQLHKAEAMLTRAMSALAPPTAREAP